MIEERDIHPEIIEPGIDARRLFEWQMPELTVSQAIISPELSECQSLIC